MGRDSKCPRCDFKAPTIAFLKAADEGLLAVAVLKLPKSVQNHYLAYFSLFRPKSGCAVGNTKAARLTNELAELVNKGHVSQKGQVDRPCPPRIWSMAMEQMLERAGSLTLPLKTHGYLRTIAWDLANKESAGQEYNHRQSEARGVSPSRERESVKSVDPLQKVRDQWDKDHAGEDQPVIPNFVMKGIGNEKD